METSEIKNDTAMAILQRLELAHPGLSAYVQEVAEFIQLPNSLMRERFAKAVERVGEKEIDRACCAWEQEGILPDISKLTQDQVGALWESLIFDLILGECIGFFPPETVNLNVEKPPRCAEFMDVSRRKYLNLVDEPYWKCVLYLNFPEFYLEPLIKTRPGREVRGCDIACGWGRVSLAMHDYENLHIECCDLTQKNLDILKKLALRAGLEEHITTRRVDVTKLPYDDNYFDFFLSFDIFEHLNDDSLDQCLKEILRCAEPGAVLYTETPMNAYCLAVTHVQDFTRDGFIKLLESCSYHGKCFKLEVYHEAIPNHFGFSITKNTKPFEKTT